jgi:uncharacterized lipoprotein YmbA
MNFGRRRILKIAPAVALAGFASCASPPTQYYRLAALPGPVLNTAPQSIRVRNISIPGYLDQDNIAKAGTAYQFASYPNSLWAGPLADMLQTTLVENLTQRLPRTTVTGSAGAIGTPAGLLIEINVLRFDPAPSGSITLLAQIALKNPDGSFLLTKTIQSTATPPTQNAPGTAAAMSTLWAGLANEIAAYAAESGV